MRNRQKIIGFLQAKKQIAVYRLILKYYEVLTYILFGGLTTLVNMLVYSFFERLIGQGNWYFSNLPAIILAILFAYVTNRSFVFDSDGSFWFEMYKFFIARAFVSFVFEYGSVFLMYNILNFSAKLVIGRFEVSWFKIVALILVLTGNYVASKLFVFKKTANQEILP